MLEIILLVMLCKRIGQIVRAKGLGAAKYQWATVGLWFGGEIAGGIFGGVIASAAGSDGFPLLAYVTALAGAALGAWGAYAIARSAAPAQGPAGFPVSSAMPVMPLENRVG